MSMEFRPCSLDRLIDRTSGLLALSLLANAMIATPARYLCLRRTTLVGGKPPKTAFGQNESPVAFGYEEIYSFPLSAVEPTPPDTPEPAATFYHQAVAALAYGLYDAAGSMFRKCLESVTRSDSLVAHIPPDQHEQFRKSWLKARITKLKEVHAIPPA